MTVAYPTHGQTDWDTPLKAYLDGTYLPNSGAITFSGQITQDDLGPGFPFALADAAPFLNLRRHVTVPNAIQDVGQFYGEARGTKTVQDRLVGLRVHMQDDAQVVNKLVTGTANNGSGLIRIAVTDHSFATGDRVAVYGITGTTEANGSWRITVIDGTHFDLQGSTFTNAYIAGGTVTNRPMMTCAHFTVTPALARGNLSGTAVNADDLDGVTIQNLGPAQATDAFYLASSAGLVTGPAWVTGFACNAYVKSSAFVFGGTTDGYAVDLSSNGLATYNGGAGAIRLPNSVPVVGRNFANNGDIWMFYLDSSNSVQVFQTLKTADLSIGDGNNVNLGGTNGTKIGLDPTQKLGFWNKAPIVRPTGWAAATNTKTRTTFDTTTVTLPALAAHVGALMDDLIAMGLIGA